MYSHIKLFADDLCISLPNAAVSYICHHLLMESSLYHEGRFVPMPWLTGHVQGRQVSAWYTRVCSIAKLFSL